MARLSPILAALATVRRDLDAIGARWSVVGGLAVGVRAEPRTTGDIDVAVAVANDSDAESVVRALVSRGYGIHLVLQNARTQQLTTVRMLVPRLRTPVIADLLFASCGVEDAVVAGATPVALADKNSLPVASRAALIAMKLLSESEARARDRQDLVDLIRRSSAEDLTEVERLIRLIDSRGANRGRDLSKSFVHFLAISRRTPGTQEG